MAGCRCAADAMLTTNRVMRQQMEGLRRRGICALVVPAHVEPSAIL
jgi:hypothetical protein